MNLIVEKTRKNDVSEIRVTSHTSSDRWCLRTSTRYRTANQHVAESQQGSKTWVTEGKRRDATNPPKGHLRGVLSLSVLYAPLPLRGDTQDGFTLPNVLGLFDENVRFGRRLYSSAVGVAAVNLYRRRLCSASERALWFSRRRSSRIRSCGLKDQRELNVV
jgi:hypothetical protein